MRTTNLLERQNQELKRRMCMVRVFSNKQSCLRQVTALLMGTSPKWVERLYLHMEESTPAASRDPMAPAAA
jgi:transposase-like protein